MERNTLTELDAYELVPRGATYIEGIAVAFESRNYLVIFTSLLATIAYIIFNIYAALLISGLCMLLAHKLMSGGRLKDIVNIEYVKPHFEGQAYM